MSCYSITVARLFFTTLASKRGYIRGGRIIGLCVSVSFFPPAGTVYAILSILLLFLYVVMMMMMHLVFTCLQAIIERCLLFIQGEDDRRVTEYVTTTKTRELSTATTSTAA